MLVNITYLYHNAWYKNMKIEDDKHNINETGNEHMYIRVVNKNKTYLGVHLKCATFLLDLNQIWTFFADFHKSPEYQIPQNSGQWKKGLYVRADISGN